MNDTFDPTVGPGPEENPAVPVDPINAGEIPAEPAPQFTAAEGPAPADIYASPANPDPVSETPAPAYAPPAAPAYTDPQPAAPVYQAQPAQPVYQAQPAQPVYQQPAQPVYPPQQPARSASYDGEARPGKKSPYAPMSGIGMAVQLFLMSIPVIGLILSILWACGVCRKIARRSLARAWLILLIIGILLLVAAAIVLRFCFTDEITHLFEQAFPGYTIKWG